MLDLFIGVPRVSSDEQKKGDSLQIQERDMRTYAERLGAQRVLIIPDDITGVMPIRQRPGGRRLYAHIDQRPANCAVCFADTSRVARDIDVFEVVQLMRDLRIAGIDFHILNRGRIDLNDPFSKVLVFMEGAAAGADNLQRTKKGTDGRHSKARRGAIVGNGRPPYCFDKTGARRDLDYAINTQRADYIRRAADLIINHGYSTEGAARWLQVQGAPVPATLYGRASRGWYQSSLLKILRNKSLIGIFRHGNIEIRREDLRIVDDATFEALSRALIDNRTIAKHAKQDYLLSSRLRCSCGRCMAGRVSNNARTYYHCTSIDNRRLLKPCGQRLVRTNGDYGIDGRVWDAICEWCSDEDRIRLGVQEHNAHQTAQLDPMRDEIRQIESDLARARTRMNRLDAAIGDASEDAAAVLQSHLVDAAEKVAALERRHNALVHQVSHPLNELDEASVIEQIRRTREGLAHADFAKRREVLRIFDVQCYLSGREPGSRRVTITLGILESVNLYVDEV